MQKNKILNILKILLILAFIQAVLNMPVSTKQGINFQLNVKKIPLYIKISEFMNRDYHYRTLTKGIIKGCKSEEEKALAIFYWVHKNIKTDIPEGWPIVDDHVLDIIIRHYGINDQVKDVFTTLCVYASLDTRMEGLSCDSKNQLIISVVKINGEWTLFDPYYGIYFTTPSGKIAAVKDLIAQPAIIKNQSGSIMHGGIKYSEYFKHLSSIDFDALPLPRAYGQNLFKRVYYETKRIFTQK